MTDFFDERKTIVLSKDNNCTRPSKEQELPQELASFELLMLVHADVPIMTVN